MDPVTQIVNHSTLLGGISSLLYILGATVAGVVIVVRVFINQFKKLNDKMDENFKQINEKLNKQNERLSIIETRLEERGYHDFRRTGTEEKK